MSGKSRGILKFKVRDDSIPVLTFCMCLCFVHMHKMFVSFSSLAILRPQSQGMKL